MIVILAMLTGFVAGTLTGILEDRVYIAHPSSLSHNALKSLGCVLFIGFSLYLSQFLMGNGTVNLMIWLVTMGLSWRYAGYLSEKIRGAGGTR
jgi:hypothetical protein